MKTLQGMDYRNLVFLNVFIVILNFLNLIVQINQINYFQKLFKKAVKMIISEFEQQHELEIKYKVAHEITTQMNLDIKNNL